MKTWIAIAMLAALGCGGISDISDPDTHVFHEMLSELSDGTSVTTITDLGFDRDAYLEAMADQDRINLAWAGDSGTGRAQQWLTISGRYGIDSEPAGNALEQRCPNNPPYTGNAQINPNHNYCIVAASKTNVYWYDQASLDPWNNRFTGYTDPNGHALRFILDNALAGDNTGTTWQNSESSVFASTKYLVRDVQFYCQPVAGAVACTDGSLAPIVLAQPTGARTRKRMANGSGWFGTITTDMNTAYNSGNLSDNFTQNQRNIAMTNTFKHEVGHMMGLGHRPVLAGEARNTMALNAGLITTIYQFTSDQKAELTAYVP